MSQKKLLNDDEQMRYFNELEEESDDAGSESERSSEDDLEIDPDFSYESGETSEDDSCSEDDCECSMDTENDGIDCTTSSNAINSPNISVASLSTPLLTPNANVLYHSTPNTPSSTVCNFFFFI